MCAFFDPIILIVPLMDLLQEKDGEKKRSADEIASSPNVDTEKKKKKKKSKTEE